MNISAFINSPAILFVVAVVANIFALAVLPKTEGFTRLDMAALCLFVFAINLWALSRILHSGVSLSLLVPMMTAIIPLMTIGIGVFVYGENAGFIKLSLLVGACGLVALASKFS